MPGFTWTPCRWWRNRYATLPLTQHFQETVAQLRRQKFANEVKRRHSAATAIQCFIRKRQAREVAKHRALTVYLVGVDSEYKTHYYRNTVTGTITVR